MGHKPETRQAGAEVTPAMIEAGVNGLFDFGPQEDFEATDPALIVREIFCVMCRAACPVPDSTA